MSGALIRPAPLGRRLAAFVYDGLLVMALWFLVGFIALAFTAGEAVPVGHPLFSTILFGLTALFFIVFWTHGGQTLGMRAWRLQVRRVDGKPLNSTQAFWRLLLAIPSWLFAGLGVLAMLFDDERRALQDRLSATEVILIPPPSGPQS